MKKLIILVLILLILPSVLASNFQVEQLSKDEVLIVGLDAPTTFDLKIYNNGTTDKIGFYNLFGFDMSPKESIEIRSNSAEEISLKVYPRELSNYRGFYTLQYFIKSQNSPDQEERLTFEIIDLKDAFEVSSSDIDPESNILRVYLTNRKNFNFEDISAKISSPFFKIDETFSLAPKEKKTFKVNLKKEDFKDLTAGFYTITADISVEDLNTEISGIANFIEKDLSTTTKREYGLIVTTKLIEIKNEGNTLQKSQTEIQKNILSRLFTSFSPEPQIVERNGLKIDYTWESEVKPGETLIIKVKTNWLLPILIIVLLIVIVVMVKKISRTDVILRKRVNFVRTKGGEFALKVSLIINAQKYVERVNLVDRLPSLVKVHTKFSGPPPTRINEETKRIEWNFEKLEAGEKRMVSYIVYSKVGIMGKFALPAATIFYDLAGKIKEVVSNRAFFVTEQSKEEEE